MGNRNKLTWIDSTGQIKKEVVLSDEWMKFTLYSTIHPVKDSGYIMGTKGIPYQLMKDKAYMAMRRFDNNGNILWTKSYFGDGNLDVPVLVCPTLNSNFIGCSLKDTFIIVNSKYNINNPVVIGLFNNEGEKLFEYYLPASNEDSNIYRPNHLFPLKNGDVMLVGYAFSDFLPDVSNRGVIARLGPDGKIKWIRTIVDQDIMLNSQGGNLFDGIELPNGDLAFSGVVYTNELDQISNMWLLKTDSMGCVTPGCTGENINLTYVETVNGIKKSKEVFFNIMPNPSRDFVTIKFIYPIHRKNSKVVLLDSNGKVVIKEDLNKDQSEITLTIKDFILGNYFINYISNNNVLQSEILVKIK